MTQQYGLLAGYGYTVQETVKPAGKKAGKPRKTVETTHERKEPGELSPVWVRWHKQKWASLQPAPEGIEPPLIPATEAACYV